MEDRYHVLSFFVRRLSKSERKVIAKLRKKPPKVDTEFQAALLAEHLRRKTHVEVASVAGTTSAK